MLSRTRNAQNYLRTKTGSAIYRTLLSATSFLSFQPKRLLSSRWKPLWTLVPKLDLDHNSISSHIVYSVLAQHAAPILRNFTHSWNSPCDTSHFDEWIDIAIARNVQHLDLYIVCGQLFEFPHTAFHCKTLVALEFSGRIELDPPPSFQLPSIKILGLYEIYYKSDNSLSSLCSGCPNLEDLAVVNDFVIGPVIVNSKISLPFLKRLRIDFLSFQPEPLDYRLEIYAPVLECFQFFGSLSNVVFLEKLAHLNEAHFNVYVCIGLGYIYPSMFQNLVRLNFKVTQSNWHVLQSLLVVAPNLEVLVLDKHYYHKSQLCWMEPPDGSGYLLGSTGWMVSSLVQASGDNPME
ncbi:hypothetical protein CMV_023230 [Castanea mollissima]|uniref:F-box/LRR-repeat protein 15/At3g58940/PEG3-like LRR domain-containing protein n=1 Tax=Castanea mollissima TaxID=60419 RepID=A0A8J4QPU8_9ROSI|nr:hypothetical protein CMV_023230 [Castanea mollissima]